jgi:hypothetical protein
MFTIYHISVTISNISLIISIKPRDEDLIHVAAVMFYTVQTYYTTYRSILQIYYHTWSHNHRLRGASGLPTSQVSCASHVCYYRA